LKTQYDVPPTPPAIIGTYQGAFTFDTPYGVSLAVKYSMIEK
jgi:hypothetical protein